MEETRLKELLEKFSNVSILVLGDFFLDYYLILKRSLSETSLETGLEAYQAVDQYKNPGAAGTVTNNLRAMNVNVFALGITGDDGNGYELRNRLKQLGVHMEGILKFPSIFTPTYFKPMMQEENGEEHELNRIDVKNRKPTSPEIEQAIIQKLQMILPKVNGVLIVDQVQEDNCGVITDTVRKEIAQLAKNNPEKIFVVDSRTRGGKFENVIVKNNHHEILNAANLPEHADKDAQLREAMQIIYDKTNQPVIATQSEKGIAIFQNPESGIISVPAIPVTGPIDIVGAGDSVTASMGAALCAGANWEEAAIVGTLASSIVIQQLGTTGTASSKQILTRFQDMKGKDKLFTAS